MPGSSNDPQSGGPSSGSGAAAATMIDELIDDAFANAFSALNLTEVPKEMLDVQIPIFGGDVKKVMRVPVEKRNCCLATCPMNTRGVGERFAPCDECGHPTCTMHSQRMSDGTNRCWCCCTPIYLEGFGEPPAKEASPLRGYGLLTKKLDFEDPLAKTPQALGDQGRADATAHQGCH